MENYNAVIDIGSNSVRLVIYYEDVHGVIYEVDQLKSVVRLSSYLDSYKHIKEEGIDRTIEVLKQFKQLCDARGVGKVLGIATAALRQAANQQDFLMQIRKETGFSIQVLSGEEEAYYGYLAVVNSMKIENGFSIDIGGGSSEVVRFANRRLVRSYSFSFGAVTLTQEYIRSENPTKQDLMTLQQFLVNQFSTQEWLLGEDVPLIGIGGTARALGKIHQKLTRYPLLSLHHYEIWKDEIDLVFHQLIKMNGEKRKSIEGMSRNRGDIIIAGIMVLRALMEKIGTDKLIISNKGLRDGVIQGKLRDDVIGYGVKKFMNMYQINEGHSRQVSFLTSQIFDQLKKIHLHPYDFNEKELLRIASLLHDAGRSINYYEFERHTFYLMVHVLLPGLTHRERIITALVASYTGSKKMRSLLNSYASLLTEADIEMVEKLGVILLIARSLDRSESGAVTGLHLYPKGEVIQFACLGKGKCPLELKLVEETGKKFRKHFGIPMEFQWINHTQS